MSDSGERDCLRFSGDYRIMKPGDVGKERVMSALRGGEFQASGAEEKVVSRCSRCVDVRSLYTELRVTR